MLSILILLIFIGNSYSSDITSICEDVREVFQIINGQLLTYTHPEHCNIYYGLGYDILEKNQESSNKCFNSIYDKICSIKINQDVYGPTCQSTLSLFRRIIESGTIQLGSNGEIIDYKNFCDKSFILVKGGVDGNISDRPQRFQSEDMENCHKIVESYNTCVNLTSSISNTSNDCLYKFKFCELSASLNNTDSKYCKNIIAPIMLMDSLFIDGYRRNTCLDISNYENYLIRKKLEYERSAKECMDTADSLSVLSRWEDDELLSGNEMSKTQESANEVFNKLHVYDDRGLAFDDAVGEFDKVIEILERGEDASMSFSQDFFRNVVIFSQIKRSLPILATHLASIEEMLVRGHVSFTNAFGFHSITSDRIEKARAMILQLFNKCRSFTERGNGNRNENIDLIMDLRNRAMEFQGISDQFNDQITLLKHWKDGVSEKELTLPSALARLDRLARV